ncbi:MAG: hypothetical protein AAF525_04210 [Pseudomonadota bacterium]
MANRTSEIWARWAACLLISPWAVNADQNLGIYSDIDLWAFSEVQPITRFAQEFDSPLTPGDTTFTHNRVEVGIEYGPWRVGITDRFDYVTSYTEDTAFVHHSNRNGLALPNDREYQLLLAVERVRARGLSLSWSRTFGPVDLTARGTFYNDLSDLQSGAVSASGDLEPITPEVRTQAETLLSELTVDNRDLSPLYDLAEDINANITIDYLYDQPEFDEPNYRTPVIVGDPNPVISGVDFSEPGGSGYSVDLMLTWQVTDQLNVSLDITDFINRFNWDQAPRTIASFDLNPALIDSIGVAQDFVDGLIVRPNDLIDEHLFVEIFNTDYEQTLGTRYRVAGQYAMNNVVFGEQTLPISILGEVFRTEGQTFTAIGLGWSDRAAVYYDLSAEAFRFDVQLPYITMGITTDSLGTDDAHTFGLTLKLNLTLP